MVMHIFRNIGIALSDPCWSSLRSMLVFLTALLFGVRLWEGTRNQESSRVDSMFPQRTGGTVKAEPRMPSLGPEGHRW